MAGFFRQLAGAAGRFLGGAFRKDKSKPAGAPSPKMRDVLQAVLADSNQLDFGWPAADPDDSKREYGNARDLDDFLTSEMVLWVDSSWLAYGLFHASRQELEIGFKDGWTAYYGDCDEGLVRSFAQAKSKGRWIHANLKAGYNPDGTWIHSRPYRHD